jgi:hypothetical protein
MSLLIGCVNNPKIDAPPCPRPGVEASEELAAIYASDLKVEQLHAWLSAIAVYCDALED